MHIHQPRQNGCAFKVDDFVALFINIARMDFFDLIIDNLDGLFTERLFLFAVDQLTGMDQYFYLRRPLFLRK